MTFTSHTVEEVSELLDRAEVDRVPISKLTTWFPQMDLGDAYAVQRAVRRRRQGRGYSVAGYRLVSMPLGSGGNLAYGTLYQSSICPNSAPINWRELLEPCVAPALAVVTNAALRGAAYTVEQVVEVIDSVMPALDVTDSRYRAWSADPLSVVADNCSAARIVLGQMRCPFGRFDPRADFTLTRNGKTIAHTTIGGTIPHPASSIASLARFLSDSGDEIPAGSIILCAGTGQGLAPAKYDRFGAFFHGLGPVTVTFTDARDARRVNVVVSEY